MAPIATIASNQEVFLDMPDAKRKIEAWRRSYHHISGSNVGAGRTMSIKAEYVIALGLPGGVILAPVLAYFAVVVAGVDRELAFDSQFVALPIIVVAILNGLRRSGRPTWWPMQLGALLAVLVAVVALALRAISLASRPGPLFVFCVVSSSILAYAAHRILRRMVSQEPEEAGRPKTG